MGRLVEGLRLELVGHLRVLVQEHDAEIAVGQRLLAGVDGLVSILHRDVAAHDQGRAAREAVVALHRLLQVLLERRPAVQAQERAPVGRREFAPVRGGRLAVDDVVAHLQRVGRFFGEDVRLGKVAARDLVPLQVRVFLDDLLEGGDRGDALAFRHLGDGRVELGGLFDVDLGDVRRLELQLELPLHHDIRLLTRAPAYVSLLHFAVFRRQRAHGGAQGQLGREGE